MNKKEIIKLLFKRGKESGIKDMEVYIQGNKTIDLAVFEGEIDKYSIAKEQGLSFRGIYNGKMGYSYTEKIDETSVDMLINEAIDNAKVIDSDDEEHIFEGSKDYKKIDSYNEELEKTSMEKKIEVTKVLEKEALRLDERVEKVDHCIYGEESFESVLINSKGLDLKNKSNIAYAYISVMVKDKDDIKTASSYKITKDFTDFNAKELAKEAVDEALYMLGAKSILSDDYPIILKNNVAASILEAFMPIFSAENVQKGLSLLKGKINDKVANDLITLVDDPFMKEGVASKSFDGEGVATKYKKVIDKGKLKTFLHNLKTAKKDGVETTGNANKSSYKAPITIAATNMYIKNGDLSFKDMVKTIDKGLLITNVEGLHAGLNPVSGDFSLSSKGFEIDSGEIKRPVNQVTIAGNFFEMLMDIIQVSDDLKFTLPSSGGYIGSPSLKIKSLSVSGN
ncbi:MAG: TldD/PmbA family protein [Firmicutes bacterium]|nr:TldD/PmbA family protein [Bacillota bacterium]